MKANSTCSEIPYFAASQLGLYCLFLSLFVIPSLNCRFLETELAISSLGILELTILHDMTYFIARLRSCQSFVKEEDLESVSRGR